MVPPACTVVSCNSVMQAINGRVGGHDRLQARLAKVQSAQEDAAHSKAAQASPPSSTSAPERVPTAPPSTSAPAQEVEPSAVSDVSSVDEGLLAEGLLVASSILSSSPTLSRPGTPSTQHSTSAGPLHTHADGGTADDIRPDATTTCRAFSMKSSTDSAPGSHLSSSSAAYKQSISSKEGIAGGCSTQQTAAAVPEQPKSTDMVSLEAELELLKVKSRSKLVCASHGHL